MEPGLVVAVTVIALALISAAVMAGVNRSLARWREDVDVPPLSREDEEASLRDEVRQHVVADNARRERRGEEPLDVDAEIERRLSEHGTAGP